MKSAAEQRNILLSERLPDALDLVSRSLQAGHGIADAMRLVTEEIPMPIARSSAASTKRTISDGTSRRA